MKRKIIPILIIFVLFAAIAPLFAFADVHGQKTNFFVEKDYDKLDRTNISATLRVIGIRSYIYFEDTWWDSLSDLERQNVLTKTSELSHEFDNRIYPVLTQFYGSENNPGIDDDPKITILLQQMEEGVGGYDRQIDEYYIAQAPGSNQREMVYLSTEYVLTRNIKDYLSHEFTHLIIFNQKGKILDSEEEIWLTEAIADYSPTLLGYNSDFQGSNLQNRINEFIESPNDSLLEWNSSQSDYAIINLFTHYLVDQYGLDVLSSIVKNSKTGISAIEDVLSKKGINKTFSEIFRDWVIAIYLNDCNIGEYYCFKNANLSNFHLTPSLIFLPATSQTNIQLTYEIQNWSARWFKIIGGDKGLEVTLKNSDSSNLVVPYLLKRNGTELTINKLENLNVSQKIILPEFAKENISLILIPVMQETDTAKQKSSYSFSVGIKTLIDTTSNDALIAQLQQKIIELQKILNELLAKQESCTSITKNLYYGMRNDPQIKCLQSFLLKQAVYPEGLITGNFGSLTKQAVVRFQEKYKADILTPLGLTTGTGNVGPSTRSKINQLLGNL
ncbi:MAG: peptidoglycan-binding domain-containing protein [Candidatus Paceibacterota bacterium]|jgi:hypothetical protein